MAKTRKKHSKEESHTSSGGDETVTIRSNDVWKIVSLVLLVLLVLVIVIKPAFLLGTDGATTGNEEQVKTKTLDFINNNLLQPGVEATISSIEMENGLYKMIVEVQGQQVTTYSSPDGEVFFPQGGIVISQAPSAAPAGGQAQAAPPAADNMPKTDKPRVELFVMSHCPYGTQIEKGILPVIDLLGDKADIQVKFVNYAMHGKKEVDEQISQYCIQQEYPTQYFKYLQCFLEKGAGTDCITQLGFEQAKIDSCVATTDTKFGITADYDDKSKWSGGIYPRFAIYDAENKQYGVQGSPTLVINGVVVSSARDSSSLKNTICNAFIDKPEECNTDLPSANPSPGFGYGTSATDSAAANCVV